MPKHEKMHTTKLMCGWYSPHTHTHVARAEHRRARKKEKPGMLSKVYAQHIEDKNKWHKRVNWIFAACK